jgi:hypothetical protein
LRRKFFGVLIALLAAAGATRSQELAGWAQLPATTFVPGPSSGQFLDSVSFLDQQPVQGISSLVLLPDGRLLALVDNGFGRRSNSADFLLRSYWLTIDFDGQSASASPAFELNDADNRIAWPLVADQLSYPDSKIPVPESIRSQHLLTGHDFDPESIEAGQRGYWIGEEFGPFLLHVGTRGELLSEPVGLPGIVSPDLLTGDAKATIVSSGGFEAMGAEDAVLHVMLEKPVVDRQLPIYRFDTESQLWMETSAYRHYPLAENASGVGAMTALGQGRFLLIERDSAEGGDARHKKLVLIDLAVHDQGVLRPRVLLDLLAIPDPGEVHDAPGAYRMPFWTIESIVVMDTQHLLIANDNNFPFGKGRGDRAGGEATEFALIRWPVPLEQLRVDRPH